MVAGRAGFAGSPDEVQDSLAGLQQLLQQHPALHTQLLTGADEDGESTANGCLLHGGRQVPACSCSCCCMLMQAPCQCVCRCSCFVREQQACAAVARNISRHTAGWLGPRTQLLVLQAPCQHLPILLQEGACQPLVRQPPVDSAHKGLHPVTALRSIAMATFVRMQCSVQMPQSIAARLCKLLSVLFRCCQGT